MNKLVLVFCLLTLNLLKADDVAVNESVLHGFEQLPEDSRIRQACLSGLEKYRCDQIKKFLYCAQHASEKKELNNSAPTDKELKQCTTNNLCNSSLFRSWKDAFVGIPYYNTNHQTKEICERLDLSPEETVQEMTLVLKTLLKLEAESKEKRAQEQASMVFIDFNQP